MNPFSTGGAGIIVVILSVNALAFVIFAWDKASGLSAEEKKEIGILKAIGWETSDVLLMKFWEGTIISLSSFLLGILLAYVHVFFTSVVLFEPVLKGWSVALPRVQARPVHRSLPGRDALLSHGRPVHGRDHHSVMAGGDDRS